MLETILTASMITAHSERSDNPPYLYLVAVWWWLSQLWSWIVM